MVGVSPLASFLKSAAKKQKVRAHIRGSKVVQTYERTPEEQDALRAKQAKKLQLWKKWKDGGEMSEDFVGVKLNKRISDFLAR